MFGLFKKKTTTLPPFEFLAQYQHKDKYFYRAAPWNWLTDTQISVIDLHSPRIFTFDPWPQQVFLEANGHLTVTEYIHHFAARYNGEVPTALDQTIIGELNELLALRIVALSDAPNPPEAKHDKPTDFGRKH